MLDRTHWMIRAWRYRLRVEPQEITFLLTKLKRGQVAVDIGAHKGAMAYWMCQRVGRQGKVVAFEPQTDLAEQLERVAKRTGVDQLRVERLALSSHIGEARLNIPHEGCSPGASLEPLRNATSTRHDAVVPTTTLDAYFSGAAGVRRVDFIKCDAEGHELEIFRGGAGLIEACRPTLLFECEVRHRASGTNDEVFSFLHELGYDGFFLNRSGLQRLDKFDVATHQEDEHDPDYAHNFAFLPREACGRVAA